MTKKTLLVAFMGLFVSVMVYAQSAEAGASAPVAGASATATTTTTPTSASASVSTPAGEATVSVGTTGTNKPATTGPATGHATTTAPAVQPEDMAAYFWVIIPADARGNDDADEIVEKILPEGEGQEKSLAKNMQEPIKDGVWVYMPLTSVMLKGMKDASMVYEYEIEKGDIVADLSYLFYEDYDYLNWDDYNEKLSTATWLIHTGDSLAIPIPTKMLYDPAMEMDMPEAKVEAKVDVKAEVKMEEGEKEAKPMLEEVEVKMAMNNMDAWVQIPMDERSSKNWDEVAGLILAQYDLTVGKDTINTYLDETGKMNSDMSVASNDYVMVYMPVYSIANDQDYFYDYLIVKGDILADLSYLFYEDYLYTDFIKDNNLKDPGLIEESDFLVVRLDGKNVKLVGGAAPAATTQPPATTNKPAATTTKPAGPETNTATTTATARPTGASTATSTKPTTNTAATTTTARPTGASTATSTKPTTNTAATTTTAPATTSTNKPAATTTTAPATTSTNKPAATTTDPASTAGAPAAGGTGPAAAPATTD